MSGEFLPRSASGADALPAVADDTPHSELAQLAERALQHAMLVRGELSDASDNLDDHLPVREEGVLSDASDNPDDYLPVRAGQALRGADLDAWIHRAENDHALRMVGRGVAYLLKQHELPGNAFTGWLKDQGIARQRAYECIGVAKMYSRLDAGVVQRVAQLPARKQVPLAKLPAGVIERLSDEGDLDALAGQPLDKFRAAISALRSAEKRAERLEARLHEQAARLEHYTAADSGGRLPPSVESGRVEGTACGLAGQRAVGRLAELAHLVAGAMDLPTDNAQRRTLLREGLAPIHAALTMIRAAAQAALADLDDTLGHLLPTGDTGSVLLSPEEVHAATQRFEHLFAAAHLARADLQKPARPRRGRGRRSR